VYESIGLKNYPAGSVDWYAVLYDSYGNMVAYTPHFMGMGEAWIFDVAGPMTGTISIDIYDAGFNLIYTQDGLPVTIKEGTDYNWNCATNQLEEVGVPPPPPLAGTITRKELEYDESRAFIPAYYIPQNESALVHVWGRNDTDATQALGIRWLVYDPDGALVEDYWDWSYGHGPGDDHEFIGGRFNLDKPGNYTIYITLSMNPAAPEIVDSYYGTLCTVAAVVPEPEFSGFGITQYQTV